MDTVKFGIVGCGMVANFHAQAIGKIDGAKLICATDSFAPARESFGEKHNIQTYASFDDFLDSDADIVCLCTPSGLHCEQAVAAASRGKHVVVEKPMAITVEQANRVIEACKEHRVKLAVISQLRFTDAVRRVKAAVDGGVLGRMVSGSVCMKYYRSPEYYSSSNWKGTWAMDGGGALMNQGIHGIDLLRYIMGPPKSVYGIARTLARKIEVEDTACAAVEFASGAIGTIEGTTSVYPGYSRVLTFCGDKGTIILEEDIITEWTVEGEPTPDGVGKKHEKYGSHSDPAAFSADYHSMQLADMVRAVREDGKPAVDQYEGYNAVELICAIYESSRTGKQVLFG